MLPRASLCPRTQQQTTHSDQRTADNKQLTTDNGPLTSAIDTPTTCFETFPLPWPPGQEPVPSPDGQAGAIQYRDRQGAAFQYRDREGAAAEPDPHPNRPDRDRIEQQLLANLLRLNLERAGQK